MSDASRSLRESAPRPPYRARWDLCLARWRLRELAHATLRPPPPPKGPRK